jgi:hypothetical protein
MIFTQPRKRALILYALEGKKVWYWILMTITSKWRKTGGDVKSWGSALSTN